MSQKRGGPPNLHRMIADVTRKAGWPVVGNEGSWNHGYDAGWTFPTFGPGVEKHRIVKNIYIHWFPFLGPYCIYPLFLGGMLGG